jgi:hypothetical protein
MRERDIADILAVPGVNFVSVERGPMSADLPVLNVTREVEDDLGELAAVLVACGQVITVDNTTAHVAGALGVPIDLMLTDGAAGGGWRWHCIGMDRAPWYPSARLFRRPAHGSWSGVIDGVIAELSGREKAAA